MQKFSLHTHTLGFDGQQTELEMLQQAEVLGWSHIGISNHFIVHPNIKKSPMYYYAEKGNYAAIYSESFDEAVSKFASHYQRIDEINQTSKIKILKGMEVDYFEQTEEMAKNCGIKKFLTPYDIVNRKLDAKLLINSRSRF